jgi:hypothetical protein
MTPEIDREVEPVPDVRSLLGNRAVTRLLDPSGGAPVSGPAAAVLGGGVPSARVHEGVAFDGPPGALAKAEGSAILLAPGAPSVGTPEGDLLVAHEAAHVRQQAGAARPGHTTDTAEGLADDAAIAAVLEQPIPDVGAAGGPHFFEARWHQSTLSSAMKSAGFTDAEAQEAYFSNWCRDLSQAFVPVLTQTLGPNLIMTVLQMLSQAKFGRPVPPELMGMYEPRQHIDNPAGQVNADLVQTKNPTIVLPKRGTLSAKQDDLDPANIAKQFVVDQSGIPEYILKSKRYILEEAEAAFKAGRSGGGLAHVGNLSHTVQDLFAHSNWVEAAVGKLIGEGAIHFDATAGEEQKKVMEELEQRKRDGKPPIEHFAADVKTAAGELRPMLQTGTFSSGDQGHDTFISIKAELDNVLRETNPFRPKASNANIDLAIELFQRLESTAGADELGDIVVAHLEDLVANLVPKGISDKAEKLASGAAGLVPKGISDKAEKLASGAAKLVSWGTGGRVDVDPSTLNPSTVKRAITKGIKAIINGAVKTGGLSEMAKWVKGTKSAITDSFTAAKMYVQNEAPDWIGKPVADGITAAENYARTKIRPTLEDGWDKGTAALSKKIGSLAKVDPAKSNLLEKRKELEKKRDDARLGVVEKLRRSVREGAGGPNGSWLLGVVEAMPLDEAIAYLASSDFGESLLAVGRMDDAEKGDNDTRRAQIDALPDWAKAGASHSQIAKDHADSPFFAAAFVVANAADRLLMSEMMAAWGGPSGPAAKGFEADFGDGSEAPGGSDAEKDRRKKFVQNRDTGDFVLQTGSPDELAPLSALMKTADQLDEYLEKRQKGRAKAGTAGEDPVARILAPLRQSLKTSRDRHVLREQTDNARRALEAAGHWGSEPTLSGIFLRIERLADRLTPGCTPDESGHDHASHAGMCHTGEAPEQHEKHRDVCAPGESADEHGRHRTEIFYKEQIDMLQKNRGAGAVAAERAGQVVDPVTGQMRERTAKDLSLDKRVMAAAPGQERFRARVDQIFNHPYDSDWWRGPLKAWCDKNTTLLAKYILERNSGAGHHH